MDKPFKISRVPTDKTDTLAYLRNVDKDLQNLFNYLEYNMSPSYGELISMGRVAGKTPWMKTGFNSNSIVGDTDLWLRGGKYAFPSTAGLS